MNGTMITVEKHIHENNEDFDTFCNDYNGCAIWQLKISISDFDNKNDLCNDNSFEECVSVEFTSSWTSDIVTSIECNSEGYDYMIELSVNVTFNSIMGNTIYAQFIQVLLIHAMMKMVMIYKLNY